MPASTPTESDRIRRGLWLAFLASVGSALFLTAYKAAAELGAVDDAVLVMLASAAVFNSLTSVVETRGREAFPRDRLSILLSIALAGLTLLGNDYSVRAVARISAPLTSVLQQTQVLFVVLMGRVFLAERVTGRFWVGFAVAVAGLVVLKGAPEHAGGLDATGALMAVGSAACFGAMNVLTRRYIHQIRPAAVNALRLWFSVALWFALERRLPSAHLSFAFVAWCAVAGAFGPYLSRTALMYALKDIPSTQTTLLGLVTPVVTLLPAFVVFGTVPSARELLGGTIMLGGIALPLLERITPPVLPVDDLGSRTLRVVDDDRDPAVARDELVPDPRRFG